MGDTHFGKVVASEGLEGNLTGNVTGDVTGNVTGDVTGNLTGEASALAAACDASALPTSDPGVAGMLWSDSGTVKVSAGPGA